MREFSRSLPMSLLRAREAVMRQFRPSLAQPRPDRTAMAHPARADGGRRPSRSRNWRASLFCWGRACRASCATSKRGDLIERRTAKADLRRGVVSISAKGLKLIEAVAPTSEAIYAEITSRYGARKLAELQDMLAVLERSLARHGSGRRRRRRGGGVNANLHDATGAMHSGRQMIAIIGRWRPRP